MASDQIVDLIRLSQRELTQLLDRLDASQNAGPGASRYNRNAVRWNLRQQRAVLTVVDEIGRNKSAVVVPRNLSTQGIGFLYGGYLHKGQRCNITLRARDGSPRSIPGIILRCAHVKGHIHEVGVRLDHPIAPSDFLLRDPEEQEQYLDAINPNQLTGDALIISADEALITSISDILADTAIRKATSSDISPLRRSANHKHNIVLLDAAAARQSADQTVRAIRTEGYTGALFLILPEQDKALQTRSILTGASEVIVKPVARQELIRSLAQHILRDASVLDSDAVPDAAQGLQRLAKSATELRSVATEQDIIAVIHAVESISQQAEQLGIEVIESLTQQCLQQLKSNGIAGAKQSLDTLADKCAEAANATDEQDAKTPRADAA